MVVDKRTYAPALHGRDSVDQLANWMSLEAWGKEANDRLATVPDGSGGRGGSRGPGW